MAEASLALILMLGLAIGLALTLLAAQRLFGPRRPNRVKQSAYESGMDPMGTARQRFSINFYLVAMIFIIFDVEVVFLYPWAVSFQEFLAEGIGMGVLMVATLFIVVLGVGLLYDIRKGGLEFE
ncbi:MAG: NADH-quinone oxidoreductase subunit A [Bacteroidota bacterium]|nr:NADH-quinone oxidoreductase subunit A [Bacteroidota bacterium]MDE2835755.1 NADH-quinone oxidoreductase subunit A [Bacteroidota bacterium]MDE2955739.1 NADH-quinone oxidoreductase subunit A [Bacteroidota bacterium]